jgi:hypothetical protein
MSLCGIRPGSSLPQRRGFRNGPDFWGPSRASFLCPIRTAASAPGAFERFLTCSVSISLSGSMRAKHSSPGGRSRCGPSPAQRDSRLRLFTGLRDRRRSLQGIGHDNSWHAKCVQPRMSVRRLQGSDAARPRPTAGFKERSHSIAGEHGWRCSSGSQRTCNRGSPHRRDWGLDVLARLEEVQVGRRACRSLDRRWRHLVCRWMWIDDRRNPTGLITPVDVLQAVSLAPIRRQSELGQGAVSMCIGRAPTPDDISIAVSCLATSIQVHHRPAPPHDLCGES